MSEKEEEESYPLKSLHDFLTELDKEWDRFRTASLIGMITSAILLIFLIILFIRLDVFREIVRFRLIGIIYELLFLTLASAFLLYEISLLRRQYKFFAKWERRIGLLLHLEERLMERAEGKGEETKETLSS